MTAIDPDIEAAPGMGAQCLRDQPVGAVRQAGVGMQEQQRPAARGCRAGVHLRRARARCLEHHCAAGAGAVGGAIAAAAVDHDQFRSAGDQRRQRIDRGADALAFIEHRHHDGKYR